MSQAPTGTPPPATRRTRDVVLVVGGPAAGKTVWIARLIETLRTRVVTVGGRIPNEGVRSSAELATGIECALRGQRTAVNSANLIGLMHAREWPPRTTEPQEYDVDFELSDGRGALRSRRSVTVTEIPGLTLLAAYSPSNPSPWAFNEVVERAAAVVLVIDPQLAVESSVQARETQAATIAFLSHLRGSAGGRGVPLVIVLAKCDRGRKVITGAGGVRRFVLGPLGEIVRAAGQARVFVSAAARSRMVESGLREPSVWRPSENVVEPMLFLLETLDTLDLVRRRRAELELARTQAREEDEQHVPIAFARKQRVVRTTAWCGFVVAALLFAGALVRFSLEYARAQQASPATPAAETTP